jgi:hypothetical protein
MELSKIDEEIHRLQKLREAAEKEALEEKQRENLLEAREVIGRLVDDLRRVEELGFTPPRLKEALKDAHGKYNPGLYVKRPKAPAGQSA